MTTVHQQSGVIPYRKNEGETEVLLVTAKKNTHWTIPKGLVEEGMTPADSAAKEAYEEGGIQGPVDRSRVGRFQYRKWSGLCDVEVFLMKVQTVLETWPEASERERKWVPVSKAPGMLPFPELARTLEELSKKHFNKDV